MPKVALASLKPTHLSIPTATVSATRVFYPVTGWGPGFSVQQARLVVEVLEDTTSGSVTPYLAAQAAALYPNEPGAPLGRAPWAVVGAAGTPAGVGRTTFNRALPSGAGVCYYRVGVGFELPPGADGGDISFRARCQVIYDKTPGLLGGYSGQVFYQGNPRVLPLTPLFPAGYLEEVRLGLRHYNSGLNITTRLVYRTADDPTAPSAWANVPSFSLRTGPYAGVDDGTVDALLNPSPTTAAPFFVQFGLQTGGPPGESMNLLAILQGVRK